MRHWVRISFEQLHLGHCTLKHTQSASEIWFQITGKLQCAREQNGKNWTMIRPFISRTNYGKHDWVMHLVCRRILSWLMFVILGVDESKVSWSISTDGQCDQPKRWLEIPRGIRFGWIRNFSFLIHWFQSTLLHWNEHDNPPFGKNPNRLSSWITGSPVMNLKSLASLFELSNEQPLRSRVQFEFNNDSRPF